MLPGREQSSIVTKQRRTDWSHTDIMGEDEGGREGGGYRDARTQKSNHVWENSSIRNNNNNLATVLMEFHIISPVPPPPPDICCHCSLCALARSSSHTYVSSSQGRVHHTFTFQKEEPTICHEDDPFYDETHFSYAPKVTQLSLLTVAHLNRPSVHPPTSSSLQKYQTYLSHRRKETRTDATVRWGHLI